LKNKIAVSVLISCCALFLIFGCGEKDLTPGTSSTLSSSTSSTSSSTSTTQSSGWVQLGTGQGTNVSWVRQAIDPSTDDLYLAYTESGTGEIVVLRYSGGDWITVGSPAFQDYAGESFAFDVKNQIVYVYYLKYSSPSGGECLGQYVSRFDGSWSSSIVTNETTFRVPSIAINSAGVPFVGQTDHVKVFSSEVWPTWVDSHYSDVFPRLDGLAYASDSGNICGLSFDYGEHLYVKKWAGSGWSDLSAIDVGFVQPNSSALALGAADELFVAFVTGETYAKARAVRYSVNFGDNTTIGTPDGFSPQAATGISIATNSIGFPYVVFNDVVSQDAGTGGVTVMNYNGTYWGLVGSSKFVSSAFSPTIKIDSQNEIYVSVRKDGQAVVYRYSP
jgi:hypothetical protein